MRFTTNARTTAAEKLAFYRACRADWQRPYELLGAAADLCRSEACRLLLGQGSATYQTSREALADARVYAAAADLLEQRFHRALGLSA